VQDVKIHGGRFRVLGPENNMPTNIALEKLKSKNIIRLYNAGWGTVALARKNKVHRMQIQKLLHINKIRMRHTSPRYHYNIKFFSKYTPESCYWAGFILSDGCVRSDRATVAIHLAKKDEIHLKKFKRAIKYTGPIRVDIHTDSRSIDISGEWFVQDLKRNFRVFPKKSLIAKFPNKVPKRYWNHLIRGILDGDGSVGLRGSMIVLSFVGTSFLLNKLSNIFSCLGINIRRYGMHKKSKKKAPFCVTLPKSNIGIISYSGKNARLILRWLYEGSSQFTRLTRKYRIYNKMV
jgi:hypothetical protein